MKPSRYNWFYSIDDTLILGYNTFTTAKISLTETHFGAIEAFYADPAKDNFGTSGLANCDLPEK
ncbi:MAG: hypothetical protein ABSB41_18010 [Anaerolineales bacterium]